MGTVGDRLRKVMEMVKPNIALPVIITFNTPISSEIRQHLESTGLYVTSVSETFNQISGKALPQNIQSIAALPFVTRVFYDEPMTMQASEIKKNINIPTSEVADAIGATQLHEEGITGKGKTIAIIDTGADTSHPFLVGAYKKTIDVTGEGDFDGVGHSVHVAGIAAGRYTDVTINGQPVEMFGVAPEAKIISIKVLDSTGSGSTSNVIRGMEKAVELGADVINMSLGTVFDGGGVTPDCMALNQIVADHNIPCVVAVGNNFLPVSCGSPGSAMMAITVGSVAKYLPAPYTVSTFSSKGPLTNMQIKPNVACFGGNIIGTKEGIYSSLAGSLAEGGKAYGSLMGSSMSCPGVAGATALLLQAGMDFSREQYEALLASSCQPIPHPQTTMDGWGTMNVAAMKDNLDKPLPPINVLAKLSQLQALAMYPIVIAQLNNPRHQEATGVRLPVLEM